MQRGTYPKIFPKLCFIHYINVAAGPIQSVYQIRLTMVRQQVDIDTTNSIWMFLVSQLLETKIDSKEMKGSTYATMIPLPIANTRAQMAAMSSMPN